MDELESLLKFTRFLIDVGESPLPHRPSDGGGDDADFRDLDRCFFCNDDLLAFLLLFESSHRLSAIMMPILCNFDGTIFLTMNSGCVGALSATI